jgi:ATP-dependent Clp protease adaptor protein ClpS
MQEPAMPTKADQEQSTAVAQKPRPKKKAGKKKRPKHVPMYHVVLLNDDDHTYEYVIEMLAALFAHPLEMGFKMAEEVDTSGRVIVFTTYKERAEFKRDQIHAYGKDWRLPQCAGSMSARIEPAPE